MEPKASIFDDESEVEIWRAQAYQVIGSLLNRAGLFQTDEAVRVLDYFAYAEKADPDFLPWPISEDLSNPGYVPIAFPAL